MKRRIEVHSQDFKFGLGGTPSYVDVLTPDDFQSFRTRQQDIQFRLLAELNNPANKNASFHFVTLTYDDEHLPRVIQRNHWVLSSSISEDGSHDDSPVIVQDKIISVALTRDLQNFNKRLRQNIARHLPSDLQSSVKYLLAYEYGKKDDYLDEFGRLRTATERPHYHAVYIVQNGMFEELFDSLVNQSWKMGRTQNNLLSPDEIVEAIAYTSKYVSKDLTITSPKFLPTKEDHTLIKSEYFTLPSVDHPSRHVEIREINPRVMTSIGLGSCYVHENCDVNAPLREDLFIKGQHKLQLNKDNICLNIPLPRYYFKRYCKDNIDYVPLFPESQSEDLECIKLYEETFFDGDKERHRSRPHFFFRNGEHYAVPMHKRTEDNSFYLRFKHIIAENNAIRKTNDFLDWVYNDSRFKSLFHLDYFQLKFYFLHRFDLIQQDFLKPNPYRFKSAPVVNGYRIRTPFLSESIPCVRPCYLHELDDDYYQLEILLRAYEQHVESLRICRNAVRSAENRKRRHQAKVKKQLRHKWTKSA